MEDKVITEYLRRSYFSVDGLWFMMIEKQFSFDKALEIDADVWSILPKIQARKVKEMLSLEGKGVSDFLKAIAVKFEAEEYDYYIEQKNEDHIQLLINRCPWMEILKKAKREHLAPIISNAICPTEFGIWISEFGLDMKLDRQTSACDGSHQCIWNLIRIER
jgi:hypothetical protein